MQRLRSAGAVSDLTSALIGGHDWGPGSGCELCRAALHARAEGQRADRPVFRGMDRSEVRVQSRATCHGREAGFDSALPADIASRLPKRGPPRTASETAPCPTGGPAHMGYRDYPRDRRRRSARAARRRGRARRPPRRPRRPRQRRDDRPSTVRVHGRTPVLPRIARSALRHHARWRARPRTRATACSRSHAASA
jgi:hypothetical protein